MLERIVRVSRFEISKAAMYFRLRIDIEDTKAHRIRQAFFVHLSCHAVSNAAFLASALHANPCPLETLAISLPNPDPAQNIGVSDVFVLSNSEIITRKGGDRPAKTSFRTLSGRLKFTVRSHKFNTDSLFLRGRVPSCLVPRGMFMPKP